MDKLEDRFNEIRQLFYTIQIKKQTLFPNFLGSYYFHIINIYLIQMYNAFGNFHKVNNEGVESLHIDIHHVHDKLISKTYAKKNLEPTKKPSFYKQFLEKHEDYKEMNNTYKFLQILLIYSKDLYFDIHYNKNEIQRIYEKEIEEELDTVKTLLEIPPPDWNEIHKSCFEICPSEYHSEGTQDKNDLTFSQLSNTQVTDILDSQTGLEMNGKEFGLEPSSDSFSFGADNSIQNNTITHTTDFENIIDLTSDDSENISRKRQLEMMFDEDERNQKKNKVESFYSDFLNN